MRVRLGDRVICASRDKGIYNGVEGTIVRRETVGAHAGYYVVEFDKPAGYFGREVAGDLFLPSELINAKLKCRAKVWWDGVNVIAQKPVRFHGEVFGHCYKPPLVYVKVTGPSDYKHVRLKMRPEVLHIEPKERAKRTEQSIETEEDKA